MLNNLPQYIANARKAIIQVATLVLTLGALALTLQSSLSQETVVVITAAVGLAGTILHYLVPNAPAPGTVEAKDIDPTEDYTEEPSDGELVEGPIVDEAPVVPSVGKHATP